MRVVENSDDQLRLSNANSFWFKWGFVTAIVLVILFGIYVAANVIRPVCWSAVAFGILLLVLLFKELPRSFNKEFLFDRKKNELTVIKRPWLGRPSHEDYSLLDISNVRVVQSKKPRRYRGYYPGIEDDMEAEVKASIKNPTYDIILYVKSGSNLNIGWRLENKEATELANIVSRFLVLSKSPES